MTLPLDDAPGDESSSSRRDRRTVLAAGVALGALVLGGGAYLLTGGDGGDVPSAASATTAPPSRPTSTSTPAPTPTTDVVPVTAAAPARNPFKVLYTAPPGSTGDTGTTGVTTTTTGAGGASGPTKPPTSVPVTVPAPSTPKPVPSTPKPAPTTPTPSPTKTPTATYELTLLSIAPKGDGPRNMTWTVDGSKVTVIRGQRFGGYGEFTVLSIRPTATGEVAVLQVGVGDPLSVAVGQTVTVTGPVGGL